MEILILWDFIRLSGHQRWFYILTPLYIGLILLGLGLWKGRKWARTSTIIWNFIEIAFLFYFVVGAVGISIFNNNSNNDNRAEPNNVLYLLHPYNVFMYILVSVLVSAIIIITKINLYLYRPYVKSYFVRPKNKKHGNGCWNYREVFYVILNGAIIYYLRGPNVKALFGNLVCKVKSQSIFVLARGSECSPLQYLIRDFPKPGSSFIHWIANLIIIF